ncbi:hypothetical protein CYY_002889 [Polysphondylium violaceum]|uniref:Ribosomal RNA large subunit methyltransferase K/L-like methyltransferase domain-containing protein n=1 Tax=Polysphondylium violaceum TaxID=133409 RepID=A0A8J4Q7F3_9MYCE|nr:hypothetical protein CYY_002889 [Polysphondylium violaceum]
MVVKRSKNVLFPHQLKLYLTVSPNLENVLEKEVQWIFKKNKLNPPPSLKKTSGGIEFTIDSDKLRKESGGGGKNNPISGVCKYLWSVANYSRVSESVRIRIGNEFPCKNFNHLLSGLDNDSNNINWTQYFPLSLPAPEITVTCHSSAIYHSSAARERILDYFNTKVAPQIHTDNSDLKAIKKKLKNLKSKIKNINKETASSTSTHTTTQDDQEETLDTRDPIKIQARIDQLQAELDSMVSEKNDSGRGQTKLYVRIENDRAQLTVDGIVNSVDDKLFHKRTLDKHITDAPIRETLASAIIHLTSFRFSSSFLWDPFVGSGTILSEALEFHKPIPQNRVFQFQHFPFHPVHDYNQYLTSIYKSSSDNSNNNNNNNITVGSDIDPRAIDASIHNLTNLGYTMTNYDQIISTNEQKQHSNGNNILFEIQDFESMYSKIESISKLYKKPFTIITNLPYGQRILNTSDYKLSNQLKDSFIRFGKMLENSDESILKDVFVLNGNPLFKSLTSSSPSNTFTWDTVSTFKNGGINVELLKLKRNK